MSQKWESGLFGCFGDCKLCLLQSFCPCLVLGYVADSLGKSKTEHCVHYFVPFLNLYDVHELRSEVKKRKKIDESKCTSFLYTVFCTFCSLNQLARETDSGPYGSSMARE